MVNKQYKNAVINSTRILFEKYMSGYGTLILALRVGVIFPLEMYQLRKVVHKEKFILLRCATYF